MQSDKLKEAATKIDAAGTGAAATEIESFNTIIAASKDIPQKQSAAALIPAYFHLFPSLQQKAYDAQLDLCEDEKLIVRCTAIRGLGEITKSCPSFLPRIARVLAQLNVALDAVQLRTVHLTLNTLMETDAKGTTSALFEHLQTLKTEVNQRTKMVEFLTTEIKKPAFQALLTRQNLGAFFADHMRTALKIFPGLTLAEYNLFAGTTDALPSLWKDPVFIRELALAMETQAASLTEAVIQPEAKDAQQLYNDTLAIANLLATKGVGVNTILAQCVTEVLSHCSTISDSALPGLLKGFTSLCSHAHAETAGVLLSPIALLLQSESRRPSTDTNRNVVLESLLLGFHAMAKMSPDAAKALLSRTAPAEGEVIANVCAEVLTPLQQQIKAEAVQVNEALHAVSTKLHADKANTALAQEKTALTASLKTLRNIESLVANLLRPTPVFHSTIPRPLAREALRLASQPTEKKAPTQPLAAAVGKKTKLDGQPDGAWRQLKASRTEDQSTPATAPAVVHVAPNPAASKWRTSGIEWKSTGSKRVRAPAEPSSAATSAVKRAVGGGTEGVLKSFDATEGILKSGGAHSHPSEKASAVSSGPKPRPAPTRYVPPKARAGDQVQPTGLVAGQPETTPTTTTTTEKPTMVKKGRGTFSFGGAPGSKRR